MTTTAAIKSEATNLRRPFKPLRFWLAIAVAIVIIALTSMAAILETRPTSDTAYLSPRAEGGSGSSQLAAALDDQGVEVNRMTDGADAISEAASQSATLFIPAPEYLNHDEQLALIQLRNADVRVVLVRPSSAITQVNDLQENASRMTTATAEPGDCGLDAATEAGAAMVRRQTYTSSDANAGWQFCYDNGLSYRNGTGGEDIVVGAADPFTDDYFSTAGNAELATNLLGDRDSVVWLDIHEVAEEPPPSQPSQSFEEPSTEQTGRQTQDAPELGSSDQMYKVLPAGLWATIVGLLVLLLGLALWKGRRLGPPVTEPLPVTVPAAETVKGRARLYRRGKAFQETAEALRTGALERIRRATSLSSQASQEEIIATVAARTGHTPQDVGAVLYGPYPEDTTQLLHTTQALDALVAAVENAQGRN